MFGQFSSWSTVLGREDHSVDSVIENLQEKASSFQVVHSNSEIIQKVMNLLKHELGVPSDISSMQKPPVLDACKKPTCLRAFPAQPRVHYSEINGGSILHHPAWIIYMCVWCMHTCACVLVCISVYVTGCVHEQKCICVCTCMYGVFIYVNVHMWTNVCTCVSVCVCSSPYPQKNVPGRQHEAMCSATIFQVLLHPCLGKT